MADSNYVSRPKRITKTYYKQFNNIQSGMRELAEIVPVVKSTFFQDANNSLLVNDMEDEDFTRGILNVITELFSASFPSVMNEDYPNTYSLSIRGDSFFFRTKNRVSISWDYDIKEIDNGNIKINMFVVFNEPNGIVNPTKTKIRQDLIDAGWVESSVRARLNSMTRKNKEQINESSNTIGDNVNENKVYEAVDANT